LRSLRRRLPPRRQTQQWAAIIEKLEELEQHSEAFDVVEDGFDADDP
jgi:hypothetical protein